jgi:hypothetical protein
LGISSERKGLKQNEYKKVKYVTNLILVGKKPNFLIMALLRFSLLLIV